MRSTIYDPNIFLIKHYQKLRITSQLNLILLVVGLAFDRPFDNVEGVTFAGLIPLHSTLSPLFLMPRNLWIVTAPATRNHHVQNQK